MCVSLISAPILYLFKMEACAAFRLIFYFLFFPFFGCLVAVGAFVTAVHLLTRLALAVTAKPLEQTPSAHYFSIQHSHLFQPLYVSTHAE